MKVTIKRTSRTTIEIRIKDVNNILVTAPKNTSDDKIKEVLKNKEDWINENLNKMRAKSNVNQDVLNYLKCYLFGEKIDYTSSFPKRYKEIAKTYLKERIEFLASFYGFNYTSLKIRDYKGRWGSCSRSKQICLNSKLVMLNKRVIDYVIIHELCHTLYLNHKLEFKNKLSSYFKDEKQIKSYLNKFSFLTKITYWKNFKIYDNILNF